MPRLVLTTVTAIVLIAAQRGPAVAQSCARDTVTGEHLRDAMRGALRAPGGEYDLLATTNSMRFQSAVFQNLLVQSLADHPDGGVLFIPYDLLWWEYLGVANLEPGDSNRAPIGRLRAFEYQQSIEVVYGPVDSVVRRVRHGRPAPMLAANVRYNWPDRPDGKRKFSFTDTLSDPQIRATNHQVMTLRFLVFSDMTALDDIKGISGRPLTGVLALVFKLIGEGNAEFARFSISEDGQQVLRTKASKLISKTVTATIAPDGRARRGVPSGRPDLAELERRLDRDLDVDYRPFRCWGAADWDPAPGHPLLAGTPLQSPLTLTSPPCRHHAPTPTGPRHGSPIVSLPSSRLSHGLSRPGSRLPTRRAGVPVRPERLDLPCPGVRLR